MRKFGLLLLLSLLLLQTGGLLFFYSGRQQTIKQFARAAIHDHHNIHQMIVLSASEFDSLYLGNNEIEVEGILYDIESTHRHGGSIVINAFPDADEQQLIKNMKNAVDASDEDDTSGIINLLMVSYILPDSYFLSFHVPISGQCTSYYSVALLNGKKRLTLPPPRSV